MASINENYSNISKIWIINWKYEKSKIEIKEIKNNYIFCALDGEEKEILYDINYITNVISLNLGHDKFIGRVCSKNNELKVFYNGTISNLNIFRKKTYDLFKVLPKENKNKTLKTNVLNLVLSKAD